MKHKLILGAIAGDVIGSAYEWHNVKTTDFPLFCERTKFTDDSVLTFATMDVILHGLDYTDAYQHYARKFPGRGYGGFFKSWIFNPEPEPYNSFGNGSAMRVSPVGWAFDDIDDVVKQARRSAEVTHNHKEGIKGAQAIAAAIWMSRHDFSKADIKEYISDRYNYNLNRTLDEIRPDYKFNETCQGSVPEAIIAFLESTDYETAIRLAISIGGDSDTLACMAGGIAEAFYKEVPDEIVKNVLNFLPIGIIELIQEFSDKFNY